MSPQGVERRRLEGYLPRAEFEGWLKLSLGRLAFMSKNFTEAEKIFAEVSEHRDLQLAPEATYYRGVSEYSASHDHTVLGNTAQELEEQYPGSEWQLRSIPWLPAGKAATT